MTKPFVLPLTCVAALCTLLTLPVSAYPGAPTSTDIDDLEALLSQPVYAASKFSQAAADAPASVTVLTAGDIRSYGWRTLAEVLNAVRGVYLRYDRVYNYVGVRGFSVPGDFSSRLLVLIDGMRVNDNIYDQAGVGREFPLDIALIERVEFIPGPGSALYGSNAVLGVVNIVTKSATALLGGLVTVELGSAGSRLVSVTHGSEFGDSQLVLAAKAEIRPGRDQYFPEYDRPATNFGVAQDADRETDRKLYAKWTHGEFTATTLLSERRKLDPTANYAFGNDLAFNRPDLFYTDRYGFADLQWQHEVDANQQLYVRGNLAQYQFVGGQPPPPAWPTDTTHIDQLGRWVGLETRWLYRGWQAQQLVLGAEFQDNITQHQRAWQEGAGAMLLADVDSSSNRMGLFANDEITVRPGLRVVLGTRLDRKLSKEHAATPRIAALWEAAPGLVVKWLAGSAYREPNAYESQYSDFGGGSIANPNLRSETLHARELALDWRALSNLRLAASLFRYQVADLIVQQQDISGASVFNNVGAVRANGVELEADYVAASGWRARGSWSDQRARDDSSGQQISNSPRSLTKLNLSVPWPTYHARFGLECQMVGERLTLAGTPLPAHTLTNFTLQVTPPASRWSFSASLYNLFDKAYADPGGPFHLQDTLAQDGLEWRLQLALQF